MTATLTINPEIIEQKIEVVFGALGGLVTSSMIHVGHELVLYRASRQGSRHGRGAGSGRRSDGAFRGRMAGPAGRLRNRGEVAATDCSS
jgi:hypothetical protein